MQEDTIIQKNLFTIDYENNEQKEVAKIPEDFSLLSTSPLQLQFQE